MVAEYEDKIEDFPSPRATIPVFVIRLLVEIDLLINGAVKTSRGIIKKDLLLC